MSATFFVGRSTLVLCEILDLESPVEQMHEVEVLLSWSQPTDWVHDLVPDPIEAPDVLQELPAIGRIAVGQLILEERPSRLHDLREIKEIRVTVGHARRVRVLLPPLLTLDPDLLRNALAPPLRLVRAQRVNKGAADPAMKSGLDSAEVLVHVPEGSACCRVRRQFLLV